MVGLERRVTNAGATLWNRFSSGYDVLAGVLRHYSPLTSINFIEEPSRVGNVRNFQLTVFPGVMTVMAISVLFSAEGRQSLPWDQRVPQ